MNFKIKLSLLFFFLFSAITVSAFTDVSNHKNKIAIEYLYENGVISGYEDETFKPEKELNRAELLKILVGGKNVKPTLKEGYKNCFSDVKEEWFAPYICYAKEKKWINGYEDGTFKPSKIVNKVESIKMLINSQEYDLKGSENVDLKFSDVEKNAWYVPYLKVAKDKNLLEVSSGKFGVSGNMKRANISENIYRAMVIGKEKKKKFYDMNKKNISVKTKNLNGVNAYNDLKLKLKTAVRVQNVQTLLEKEIVNFEDAKKKLSVLEKNKLQKDRDNKIQMLKQKISAFEQIKPEILFELEKQVSSHESQKKDYEEKIKKEEERINNLPENIIKNHCENKWSDDLDMKNYCIKNQYEALEKLNKGKPYEVAIDDFKIIRANCASKWATDFGMRVHCEKSQFEGIQSINLGKPNDIDSEDYLVIKNNCKNKWVVDFSMQSYCLSKEYSAIRELRSNNAAESKKIICKNKWKGDFSMRAYCESK